MSHPAQKFIFEKHGPMGSIRSCTLCNSRKPFTVFIRKGTGGFVNGNRARGELIQHIKTAHPEQLAGASA
jgi:hypothetical protein